MILSDIFENLIGLMCKYLQFTTFFRVELLCFTLDDREDVLVSYNSYIYLGNISEKSYKYSIQF